MNDLFDDALFLVFIGALLAAVLRWPPGAGVRWTIFVVSAAKAALALAAGNGLDCVIWSAGAALWARAIIRFDEDRSRDERE